LRKGDRLVIEIAGGGGYGEPRKRAREDVERDLREGLITEEEAREVFGLEREAVT
jgi:N-methylhydantoinase B